MGYRIIQECDICGGIRKDSNNWFAGYDCGDQLIIIPYDGSEKQAKANRLLCGQECVLKYISMNLAELHRMIDALH